MKKSIFIFATFLLAFSFYFTAAAPQAIAGGTHHDSDVTMTEDLKMEQEDLGTFNTISSEIEAEREVARQLEDMNAKEGEETSEHEDNPDHGLPSEENEDDKNDGGLSMN